MKIERLIGILTILLQNERVTAGRLAERFEVSTRTIARDVDALCLAGIPIVSHQGKGGGISIIEGFRLDKSVLTKAELSTIIAGIKGIGTVSEQTQIERTLEKLGANATAVVSMTEPVVIDLASYYKSDLTDKIEAIKKAIIGGKLIEFDYYYEKGESHRRIEPYLVVFQWASWYVFGFCLERMDWRMFMLNRLWQLDVPGDEFEKRDIPAEKRNFFKHLADDKKIKAIFDKSEKYKLIEAYGWDSFYETDEGLHFEFG